MPAQEGFWIEKLGILTVPYRVAELEKKCQPRRGLCEFPVQDLAAKLAIIKLILTAQIPYLSGV
jgi:hypothetical protein